MGNACCVAARDKMVLHVPNSSAPAERRHSPTWSFRWDHNNRGRVAGEDSSLSWLSDGISRHDGSDLKFESAFVSSQASPLDTFRTQSLQKSPASGNKIISAWETHVWCYSLVTFDFFLLQSLLKCHGEQKKDVAFFSYGICLFAS